MKTNLLICTAVFALTLSSFSASAQMQRPERPEGRPMPAEQMMLTPRQRAEQRTNEMDKTGMAREDMSSVRNERFLYAAVWSVIAILPIVLELWKLINGSVFGWQSVFRWWIGMIPLILIFLIHNHFLLPRFMKKGRKIIFCCDNTVPHTRSSVSTGGVGLSNIRRRLDLLYGEDYSLRISQADDRYSVTLIIPSL